MLQMAWEHPGQTPEAKANATFARLELLPIYANFRSSDTVMTLSMNFRASPESAVAMPLPSDSMRWHAEMPGENRSSNTNHLGCFSKLSGYPRLGNLPLHAHVDVVHAVLVVRRQRRRHA